MQRHPYKQIIMHLDFQRVDENQAIRVDGAAALPQRGEVAGRQGRRRRRHARAQRSRSELPAEGPAGVHRHRPVGPVRRRHRPPVRDQAAGRRRDPRAEARQGTRRGGRHRQARQGRDRGSAGRSPGAPKCRRPRSPRRTKRRSKSLALAPARGRRDAMRHAWQACASSSGWAIPVPNTPGPGTTPGSGLWTRWPSAWARVSGWNPSSSAKPRRSTSRGRPGLAAQAGDLHEPQRQVGHRRACATGRSSRKKRCSRTTSSTCRPGIARLKFDGGARRPERPARHHATAGSRHVPPPAHRHRPSRPQGPSHAVGAGQARPRRRGRHPARDRRRDRRPAARGRGRHQRGDETAQYRPK